MKMNNYGFGFKETFIYLGLLLLILLFTSYSISSFYDNVEINNEEKFSYLSNINENNNKPVENNNSIFDNDYPSYDQNEDTNVQVIPMDYYYDAEKKLYDAVMKYALENEIPASEYLYTVRLEDLIKLKYIDKKIVDYVDGSDCTGYGNIIADSDGYQVDSYIYCKNYKTEGYK